MKMYEILIPARSNDGRLEYDRTGTVTRFLLGVAAQAGGYTRLPYVDGFWRDERDGEVYQETMIPVRVSCEPETMAAIIGDALAAFADQKCIMSYVVSEAVTVTERDGGTVPNDSGEGLDD